MYIRRLFHLIWMVLLSVILGFVIRGLFVDNSITYIRTICKINLVLSTLLVLIFLVVAAFSYLLKHDKIKSSLEIPGIALLISGLGSLVTTIMLLAIRITPAVAAAPILVGIGGFFFVLMILTFIFFSICLACKSKYFPDIV